MEDSLSEGLSGRIPVHTEEDKPSDLSAGTKSVFSFYPPENSHPQPHKVPVKIPSAETISGKWTGSQNLRYLLK